MSLLSRKVGTAFWESITRLYHWKAVTTLIRLNSSRSLSKSTHPRGVFNRPKTNKLFPYHFHQSNLHFTFGNIPIDKSSYYNLFMLCCVTLLISIMFYFKLSEFHLQLGNFQKNLIQYTTYLTRSYRVFFLFSSSFLLSKLNRSAHISFPYYICSTNNYYDWIRQSFVGNIFSTKEWWAYIRIQRSFNVFPKKHFEIDENKQKQFQIINKIKLNLQQTQF